MKVEELVSLLDKHKNDKNYQYRNLDPKEFQEKANTSFNRLTKEQQMKVIKVCKQYDILDVEFIARARFMAQTNLFFLCKLLQKYSDVSDKEYIWDSEKGDGQVHNTHEEICNSFFVRKNPSQSSFKEFADTYIDKKERLLLVPRGGFKSSMDMADCVQWIICFPEVTILVLTGVLQLAKDFVGEIKGHFTLEDADDTYADLFQTKKNFKARTWMDGTPVLFQVLFPEHCIPKDDGKEYEYQTPAVSVVQKECSVRAASIEQSLTGWHFDVLKLDDVVTNENSLTIDRLKAVNKQVSINQAMLHPYGFYDIIGTWYDSEDVYGKIIKNEKKFVEEGEDFPTKIYIRAAWWPNKEAQKQGKIEEEMQAGDFGLWFTEGPHSLTYEFLRKKKKTDPYFAIKYLNDPTQMHIVKFPRELLIRRTIQANLIPGTGMIVTTVDTAYSTQSWADYTVIITALIYGGKFYIIDMQRGRFNEYELPKMVAATALKWKPMRICIEESVGVKWIGREIYREMDALKCRVPVQFVSLGKGNKSNNKQMKAKPVLRFLGDERLLFSYTMPGKEELYDELEKFGTAASTHDDIVDALSLLIGQFASYADMEGKATAQLSDFYPDPKMKSFYDQTYCLGKHAKQNIQEMMLDNPQLSPQEAMQQAIKDAHDPGCIDPLSDLFS